MVDVHLGKRRSYKRSSDSYRRGRHGRRPLALWMVLMMILSGRAIGEDIIECCTESYAPVDYCTAPVDVEGQQYFCKSIPTSEGEDCVTCLPSDIRSMYISKETACSSCCMRARELCEQWSWGAVLSTLSVSIIFATCSGLLALTEKRRKRKGISLARAWSIPQGMPILRATVVDLSDAVRRRSSFYSTDDMESLGLRGGDGSEELEHVGLLEEMPCDSIYGALSHKGGGEIPVAKVSEGVVAEAWHPPNPILYGERGLEVSSSPSPSPSPSASTSTSTRTSAPQPFSRWRPGRALARHARRFAAAATAHRDSHPEVEAWSQYCEREEVLSAVHEQEPPALPEGMVTIDAHPPDMGPSMR